MKRVGFFSSGLIVTFILTMMIFPVACTHEVAFPDEVVKPVDPPTPGCTSNGKVCFESSVLPIFLSSCARSGCHNAQSRKEGYILDSYSNIVRKGIVPGNANESKLYKVLFENGEDRMPPDAALTQAQKDSIKVWIDQGALNTTGCNCFCDPSQFTYNAVVKPIISNTCVGCHKPGNLGGNIDLSTYDAVRVQALNGKLFGAITHTTGYSAMPKGGKLSTCQIEQINNWIKDGAKDN